MCEIIILRSRNPRPLKSVRGLIHILIDVLTGHIEIIMKITCNPYYIR